MQARKRGKPRDGAKDLTTELEQMQRTGQRILVMVHLIHELEGSDTTPRIANPTGQTLPAPPRDIGTFFTPVRTTRTENTGKSWETLWHARCLSGDRLEDRTCKSEAEH